MKHSILKLLAVIFASLTLIACGSEAADGNIKVGVISGPEADLMKVAQTIAKKNDGVTMEIIEFSDYSIPNTALNDGSIDANVFQHLPYLEAAKKSQKFKLSVIGKTFIYPMGMYSKKVEKLADLENKATVAIPNDPSNEARALLLLQDAGLIKLKQDVGFAATPRDIIDNPKSLRIQPIDAAQLPRVLQDVAIAIINSNYAVPAGLLPNRDALHLESGDSPYANIIVVRAGEENRPEFIALVKALNSPEIIEKAKAIFQNQAVPAWDTENN